MGVRRQRAVVEVADVAGRAEDRLALDGALVAVAAGRVRPHDAVAHAQLLADAVDLRAGADLLHDPGHLVAEDRAAA